MNRKIFLISLLIMSCSVFGARQLPSQMIQETCRTQIISGDYERAATTFKSAVEKAKKNKKSLYCPIFCIIQMGLDRFGYLDFSEKSLNKECELSGAYMKQLEELASKKLEVVFAAMSAFYNRYNHFSLDGMEKAFGIFNEECKTNMEEYIGATETKQRKTRRLREGDKSEDTLSEKRQRTEEGEEAGIQTGSQKSLVEETPRKKSAEPNGVPATPNTVPVTPQAPAQPLLNKVEVTPPELDEFSTPPSDNGTSPSTDLDKPSTPLSRKQRTSLRRRDK